MTTPTEPATDDAWWYRGGTWHRGRRLIEWNDDDSFTNWHDAAHSSGFHTFASHGDDTNTGLHIFRRLDDKPPYTDHWAIVLDAEGSAEVYTASLPDTMAVLAQWAPAVQALNHFAPVSLFSALYDLASDKAYGPELDAVIRRIAKAAR